MAGRSSNPIQQLLAAEKKATIVVNDAKSRRTQRIKTARDEVQQEIDVYKAECDAKTKQQEEDITKSFDELQKLADDDIKKQLDGLLGAVAKQVDQALQVLLTAVCDINCELHINYDIDANKTIAGSKAPEAKPDSSDKKK